MYSNRSSLREFVRYVSRKVANGELFGKKPTDVPEFEGLAARRIDEIAASVDKDHVLLSSISGPPERARMSQTRTPASRITLSYRPFGWDQISD